MTSQAPSSGESKVPNHVPRSGTVWRRVDLHLHTPAVDSFSLPPGSDIGTEESRRRIAQVYVEQIAKTNISVCALTDYNRINGEWFSLIREAAAPRRIVVFPGVEMDFEVAKHGLHILAIFDLDAPFDQVNDLIRSFSQDFPTPLVLRYSRSHQGIKPKTNPADCLKELRQRFPCLLIPPHPDQTNGFAKSFGPKEAAGFLKEISPDAIEHCPQSEFAKMASTGVLTERYLSGLARVEFSDPKRIEDIGTKSSATSELPRATYLKLSAVDLDSLRIALHDPETRVAVGHLPVPKHARIREMQVEGSGFLGNLSIEWNDDLSVLIGGRGTGKSAILETLRYALDMEPYSDESSKTGLVRFALGSGGKVALFIEGPWPDGKVDHYRIERVLDGEPLVYELTNGLETRLSIPPSDVFGPLNAPCVFGQREIYFVSASEEYRLRLLDDLIGEKARQHAAEVRKRLEALGENARAITDAKTKLSKRDEHKQRLASVDHEISLYKTRGIVEKMRAATDLQSDGDNLRKSAKVLDSLGATWHEAFGSIGDEITTTSESLRRGKSSQKEILREAADIFEKLSSSIADLQKKGNELLSQAKTSLDALTARWAEAVRPSQEELNRIKREIGSEKLDPDKLLRLTRERDALLPIIEGLNRVEEDLKKLRKGRDDLLRQLQEKRHEEHTLRRERAVAISDLLKGRVRLSVRYKGQKTEYRSQLGALMKGSGITGDAIEKIAEPESTDGPSLAKAVRAGVAEVRKGFHLTDGMAQKLVSWLLQDEARLFQLETLIPDDSLDIELRLDTEYRPLDRLSAGQRATAILLLLFALQDRILVLDQPEDDLDNQFVYQDIVTILREQKGLIEGSRRRQIIAVTHNANIPVLGDAELVVALDVVVTGERAHAHVLNTGSIDDRKTRDLIKKIMEGGEEAFRRRAEKYGAII